MESSDIPSPRQYDHIRGVTLYVLLAGFLGGILVVFAILAVCRFCLPHPDNKNESDASLSDDDEEDLERSRSTISRRSSNLSDFSRNSATYSSRKVGSDSPEHLPLCRQYSPSLCLQDHLPGIPENQGGQESCRDDNNSLSPGIGLTRGSIRSRNRLSIKSPPVQRQHCVQLEGGTSEEEDIPSVHRRSPLQPPRSPGLPHSRSPCRSPVPPQKSSSIGSRSAGSLKSPRSHSRLDNSCRGYFGKEDSLSEVEPIRLSTEFPPFEPPLVVVAEVEGRHSHAFHRRLSSISARSFSERDTPLSRSQSQRHTGVDDTRKPPNTLYTSSRSFEYDRRPSRGSLKSPCDREVRSTNVQHTMEVPTRKEESWRNSSHTRSASSFRRSHSERMGGSCNIPYSTLPTRSESLRVPRIRQDISQDIEMVDFINREDYSPTNKEADDKSRYTKWRTSGPRRQSSLESGELEDMIESRRQTEQRKILMRGDSTTPSDEDEEPKSKVRYNDMGSLEQVNEEMADLLDDSSGHEKEAMKMQCRALWHLRTTLEEEDPEDQDSDSIKMEVASSPERQSPGDFGNVTSATSHTTSFESNTEVVTTTEVTVNQERTIKKEKYRPSTSQGAPESVIVVLSSPEARRTSYRAILANRLKETDSSSAYSTNSKVFVGLPWPFAYHMHGILRYLQLSRDSEGLVHVGHHPTSLTEEDYTKFITSKPLASFMLLKDALDWYQARISLYDKQSWETTVEQRILQGFSFTPRKTAKLQNNLIDVDLIRGSTFPKSKPKSGIWINIVKGILRITFFPFYMVWWMKQTSKVGLLLIFFMYFSTLSSTAAWIYSHSIPDIQKNIFPLEIILPNILIVLLSVIHSLMVSSRKRSLNIVYTHKNGFRNKILRQTKKRRIFRRPAHPVRVQGRCSLCGNVNYHNLLRKPVSSASIVKAMTNNRSHSEEPRQDLYIFSHAKSCSENDIYWKSEFDWTYSEALVDKRKLSPYEEKDNYGHEKNEYEEYCDNSHSECNFGNGHIISEVEDICDYDHSSGEKAKDTEDDCICSHDEDDDISVSHEQCSQFGCQRSKIKLAFNASFAQHASHKIVDNFSSTDEHSDCDWTNNGDLSYSSESDGVWDDFAEPSSPLSDDHLGIQDWYIQGAPAAVINATPSDIDKVSCKIWEGQEVKKVNLSVLDFSSAVISKVDAMHHTSSYFLFGLVMAFIIALLPSIYKLGNDFSVDDDNSTISKSTFAAKEILFAFDSLVIEEATLWCFCICLLCIINRFLLSACFFFLLSVAEQTFRQRFLYAKHFCFMTSARRARKYDLPHFRLNKVLNIKAWLSVRSCLKKRGPQHTVDVIVSATFILGVCLISALCVELLKEEEKLNYSLYNYELFIWCFTISIYLIRFMTLGAMINKKYSNPSILLTEQINMYLHMEQKPQKKDELMLANNVLKLVSVLLKELDSPFKISGLSANPLLYNITKFVVLSACSGVLSDILGFKLKLYKIKFK